MITQTFDLNLIPNSAPVVVHVDQYDHGTGRLIAKLYNGSTAYTPAAGATAMVQGTKLDGHGFMYAATLSGNTVTMDLTEQMSIVAGRVCAQVVVDEGDDRTGTFVFFIDVQKSALPADTDMSRSDYQLVEELLETAQSISTNFPYIGENGNWWYYDVQQGAYVDSGVDASITISIGTITTLPAGSLATVTNSGTETDPIFDFGIPEGYTGATGPAAGFGTPTASVDANVGTPSVSISASGPDTAKVFDFQFHNMKGATGNTGATGPAAGFGTPTASVDANVGTPSVSISASGPDTAKVFEFQFHNLKGEPGTSTGMPTGGTTGQALVKRSNTNYDNEWGDVLSLDEARDAEVVASKNLFDNQLTTTTEGNVTFTKNADKSVSTSGTSNADWVTVALNSAQFLKAGDYTISGIENGSQETYRFFVAGSHIEVSGSSVSDFVLYDGSKNFTVTQDSTVSVSIIVRYSGVNMTGKTFYPMITDASEPDQTYMPYFEPLKDSKLSIKNQQVLGAWNLYRLTLTTQTKDAVVWTANTDGTVKANGTTSADDRIAIGMANLSQGDYFLSGCPTQISPNSWRLRLSKTVGGVEKVIWHDGGDATPFTVTSDYAGSWLLEVRYGNNKAMSNILFKPMIALNSNTTYVAPTMTNRELTENLIVKEYSFSSTLDLHSLSKIYKYGRIANFSLRITTGNNSINANTQLATIPDAVKPLLTLIEFTGNNDNAASTDANAVLLTVNNAGVVTCRSALSTNRVLTASISYITKQ